MQEEFLQKIAILYYDMNFLTFKENEDMNFDIPYKWGSIIHIAIGVPVKNSYQNVDTETPTEKDIVSSDIEESVISEEESLRGYRHVQ